MLCPWGGARGTMPHRWVADFHPVRPGGPGREADTHTGKRCPGAFMGHLRHGWIIAAAGLSLLGPAIPSISAAPYTVVAADDWATKAWDAASRGDQAALDELLKNPPPSLNAESPLVQSIKHLLADVEARETKRASEISRVRKELDKALAAGADDLNLSMAIKSAVELSMLATDKDSLMKEPKLRGLVMDADSAARKAESRGDWMMASELYYRLDLLLEDNGTYRDDVKRESQRLAMIRMYAPQRLWDLKNARRNAEIDWRAKQPKEPAADGKEPKDDTKPLPPYNPMGDDFHQKLEGIDETMVSTALRRGYERHVERTTMDKILRGAIEAVHTLVTTDDLKGIFPGMGEANAKEAFLKFLEAEDEKIAKLGNDAGMADLFGLVQRTVAQNEKTVKLPKTALLHEFGNGGLAALDEFSAVIWPDEVPRFERNTQGRFVGVGVQIELDPLQNIRIVTPLDGTPAQKAGLRTGDLIKKVDGVSTIGFTLDQAVDVITGPEDTQVVLTIERDQPKAEGGSDHIEKEYKLHRSKIEIATVKGWRRTGTKEDEWDWFVDPSNRIGYVRLTQFADRTDNEFDNAIDAMKSGAGGLNGLILDLRYNPGGLLDQAVAITSRFVDGGQVKNFRGLVVTTHAKDNTLVQREPAARGAARLSGIPVVVLINEGSASASEIVSGALNDYAHSGDIKAVLIGNRSYGKGSVQNVWPLDRAGTRAYVKITTQYYHLPGDRMIHRRPGAASWGVEPDLKVDMLPTQIADTLTLRLNSDVLKVDENGKRLQGTGTDAPANPDDLITKGMDVQLEQALVLLQTQVPAAVAGSNAAPKHERNN